MCRKIWLKNFVKQKQFGLVFWWRTLEGTCGVLTLLELAPDTTPAWSMYDECAETEQIYLVKFDEANPICDDQRPIMHCNCYCCCLRFTLWPLQSIFKMQSIFFKMQQHWTSVMLACLSQVYVTVVQIEPTMNLKTFQGHKEILRGCLLLRDLFFFDQRSGFAFVNVSLFRRLLCYWNGE